MDATTLKRIGSDEVPAVYDRLRVFYKSLNCNENSFSRLCQIATGVIFNARSKNKLLSINSWQKIFLTFPQLSEEWLFFGNGEMLKQTATQNQTDNQTSTFTNNSNSNSTRDEVVFLKKQIETLQKEKMQLLQIIEKLTDAITSNR